MSQIEEFTVPPAQQIAYDNALALVRSFSENKLRRDPTCKFQAKKEIPIITNQMLRRFLHDENEAKKSWEQRLYEHQSFR